jgi:hypothetical protein
MPNTLESAVLYTFSTIPQTLGAAFAVLSAFVIYRFQGDVPSADDIRMAIEVLDDRDRNDLNELVGRQQYRRFFQELERIFDATGKRPKPENHPYQYPAYRRIVATMTQPDIRLLLRRAFLWTGAVIVGSVIALCFERPLTDCTPYAIAALTVGVAGLAWCLWLYWRLIEPLIRASQ